MSTKTYVLKHKALGLCRSCPKPCVEGSTAYCDYHRERTRVRRSINSKKAIIKLRSLCLAHYGNKCNCCGINIQQFLTLDHLNRKGNIQRKKLFGYNVSGIHMYRWLIKNNFPKGFQILCMNCNWATRYGTICPHQLERSHSGRVQKFTKLSSA